MTQYRVRLLQQPVIAYNGHSYMLASKYMDAFVNLKMDHVLERRASDGWESIVSVEMGDASTR